MALLILTALLCRRVRLGHGSAAEARQHAAVAALRLRSQPFNITVHFELRVYLEFGTEYLDAGWFSAARPLQ